ncbi:MAG TPA: MG2 domain-containing protein [Kofleriaceae bacterium]|nr:MG2 domain-containing protein [Kofleriaceae bacterium]
MLGGACGGNKSDDKQASNQLEDAKDEPKRSPITAAKLAPIIHELGAPGVTPTSIVVSFATPVIERDEAGRVTSLSSLKLTPEVPGVVVYKSVSELEFRPNQPFDFDTTYQVSLAKVETRDGVLEPDKGMTWAHSFKTPKFQFLGWAPTEVDLFLKKVTMELQFSGPIAQNVARNAMTFTIDGVATQNVKVIESRGYRLPSSVAVEIVDPRLKVGSKLAVAIKADLPSLANVNAKLSATNAEYTVAAERVVSLKDAKIVESGSGYFLQVTCDDKAARPGRSAYYDEDGHPLSMRCQLSEEAMSRIKLDPPVKNAYITSGTNGFRLFGDFKRGVYTIQVEPGARSVDGGVVLAPFARAFNVAARTPQLMFSSTGRYLPRKAWSNLGIKHLNVEEVNLLVRQVPPENLVFWLGNPQGDAADDRTSNLILKKTLPLRGDADVQTTTWQDVSALLPSTTKGVLELKLAGVGVEATSRLLLTNLSLVAKKTSVPEKPWLQTVQVWALDIDTSDLLSGVEVTLVRKSGKVVAKCTTSSTGCTLDVKDTKDPDQAEPFALIAKKGDDLTYLRYQDLKTDTTESSTAGLPYHPTGAQSPYRAAVFADRGAYRPGDTAHVVAIIRENNDRAPGMALPVDVKVIDPRAKVVRKLTLKTNPGGVIVLDHALPAFADTGHWRVQLAVADKPLDSYDLLVEEFVPERMRVTIAPKQPETLVGTKPEFDVEARYLFGGSALDSDVQLACSMSPQVFAPKDSSEYTFGLEPKSKSVALGESTAQLDLQGRARIACPDGDGGAAAFTQTTRLDATASVLEAGSGRATVKRASMTLHPEKFYIGLKSKTSLATTGQPLTVEGILVDWTGKPIAQGPSKLDVELVHLEYDYGYGYDENSGEARYDHHVREVPEGKRQVDVVGGKFKLEVTPGNADAGYLVRVRGGKAVTELALDGIYPYEYYDDYGDGDRIDQTPRPSRPTPLVMKLPDEVEVGKAATAKVIAPYKGKILWTVETDGLVRAEWKDTAGGETSWNFSVDKFVPNVYVSAFLVKDPHLESKDAFLPDRAFAVESVRIAPTQLRQDVKLTVPKEVRSSSPLSVQLDLGPTTEPTFATVAVVDEGILSLTSFATPNPLERLQAQRALGVETYETIGWTMLHQPAGASSKTGGGDDYDEGGVSGGEAGGVLGKTRVQPVKPVALFSGIVQVGADGKATIPFQIPSYRGQVRVMAFTASASKIGRAEAKVIVRDPLVVQVTFPRFITQNDEIQIPVFLTNVSGGPLDVELAIDSAHVEVAGLAMPKDGAQPIAFTNKPSGTVRIQDGFSETVVYSAKAQLAAGGARLKVVATAKGAKLGTLTVQDTVEVPALPAGPKDRVIQKVKLEAGTLDLAKVAALKGWAPMSETTTFWMTSNPYGESFDHLSYLIHYPYGCIEQTTSSTRPLLYVGALAEQVDPKLAQLKIEDMVLSGINRIFSMQTPSGGFGYWPGALEPEDWATAYATHMLLDAKKLGYTLPADRLDEVLRWIDQRAAQYERGLGKYARHDHLYYDGQVQAYFHYVLALAGKGKKARILKLISDYPANPKQEQAEDLYLLKAALYLAGDRRYEKDLKAVDASPITADRTNSWSFYSDRRRRGLMLSTFFDLFGVDPAGEPLAQRVAQSLTGQPSYYYNTQELVWGVTGLGKWVTAQKPQATADGKLVANGLAIGPRATKQKTNDRTWTVVRASEYKTLTLDVPASAAGMWLVVRSEGTRTGATYKTGGNALSVKRTYRKLDGTAIDPAKGELKLGDLVYVEIELANTSGQWIENIALVDRLPAGFEIENPRLGRGVQLDWVKQEDLWGADFMNMRDDHLEAFGGLAAKTTKKVVYTVRAVTSGKFTIPPVEAEAMYDPTLWARAAGGTAVIAGPWTKKTI